MSFYKRISGIRPSPLQNLHLQPSDPPPSATKEQLILFDRVLGRRLNQLNALPLVSLSTVYGFLADAETPTAQEIKDLIKKLPSKAPSTGKQYVSFVLYLLIENFHKSIDARETCDIRKESLAKLQHILDCLDAAYADYNEERTHTEQISTKKGKNQQDSKDKLELEARKKADQEEALVKERELLAKQRAEREAKEKAEREAKLRAEREAKEKAEREAKLRAEREAREKAEREAKLRAEREAKEKAEREAREKAEREAREKAEREAKLRAEREAKEKAEREAKEKAQREAKEKAEREAKLRAEREAKEKTQREAKEKAEREAKERADQEAKRKAEQESRARAEQEAKERAEQEVKGQRKQLSHTAETNQSQSDKNNQKGTDLAGNIAKQEALSSSTMGASLSKKVFSQAGTAQDDAIEILDSDDESVDNNNIGTGSGDNALESSSLEKAAKDDTSQQGKTHSDEQEEEYLKSALSKKNSVVIFSKEKPVARLPVPDNVKVPSRKRTVVFQPDVKCGSVTFSSSLEEDRECRNITFHEGQSNAPDHCSILHGPDLDKIYDRYTSWDPFWEVVQDLSLGSIHGFDVGYKTTRIVSSSVTTTNCPPLSAVEFQFNIPPSIAASLKKSPFQKQYKERRLILRSLPIIIPEKYKKARSDTHLWPKGTFVQLNNVPILIVQRRQQSHDHMLWKGLSHMLDLTQAISNYEVKQKLTICTKDADSYNFQLVVCEYIPPNVIFDRCVGEGPLALTKLTFEEGRALIQQNFDEKNAVVLDDSDGESETPLDKSNISLTISLLCGASMSAIQVPVRGKKCKHMQCFDLKNYLLSNSNVSGGRWRCLVCEDFVPVRDLIIDGFMGKILEEHGKDVSTSRDKVEILRNGTWKFLPENKLRYNKKRPCPSDQPDSAKRSKHKNGGPPITEIIDIIDD